MKYLYGLMVWLVLIWGYGECSAQPAQPLDSLKARADSLFDHQQEEAALNSYNRILESDSTYYPAWWKSSLMYARIGHQLEDEEKTKQYYQKSLSYAKRALKLHPEAASAHFVMGVAMGRKALIAGPKERVAASRAIKKHAVEALQADTLHGGAHHLLGRWHLEVTNLNFAERMAAKWLFGGLPEGASMEQSLAHLKRATELGPDFILYWYDLGRAYHRMERTKDAIESLDNVLQLEAHTPSDSAYQAKAEQLYYSIK